MVNTLTAREKAELMYTELCGLYSMYHQSCEDADDNTIMRLTSDGALKAIDDAIEVWNDIYKDPHTREFHQDASYPGEEVEQS